RSSASRSIRTMPVPRAASPRVGLVKAEVIIAFQEGVNVQIGAGQTVGGLIRGAAGHSHRGCHSTGYAARALAFVHGAIARAVGVDSDVFEAPTQHGIAIVL